MIAFWYHFAILFEALFILTAVDAGTRAGRFMLQDLLGTVVPALKKTDSLPANLIATALCVALWGYFLYQGVVDPLGGINTLWPLFGVANQMLAAIALTMCAAILFKMKRQRYAWVAILPTLFLLTCTLYGGWLKVFSDNPKVGFLALANKYSAAIDKGVITAPAKTVEEMERLVFNAHLDAGLCLFFMFVIISVVGFGIRTALQSLNSTSVTTKETPYVAMELSK
jgi:carbon starvation protein